jgi:redox-sensitive bicupin YhaK (pirin superfamily)
MSPADYQEFDAGQIPLEGRDGGVEVRVVAGRTSQGLAGPVADGAVDALYFDVSAPAGARFAEPIAADHQVMVVVYDGAVRIGDRRIEAVGAVFLGEGESVEVVADTDARFLIIAGRPLNEPVAWGGPFVMNTREEVVAAFDDYRAGRF